MKFNVLLKAKYPVVKQYDQIDCGPAALLSVLIYYGGNDNLVHVRELCQTSVKGSTMLGVVNAAKELGFDALGASGEYEDLMKEEMPCLAHVITKENIQHFVVVYKINNKNVLIGDPALGKYKLSKTEFLKIWQQKAVILLKPKDQLYLINSQSWVQWIKQYLKKEETWLYQSIFLGVIYTLFGLLTAVIIQWLIDRFIPDLEFNKIIYTGIFLLVLLMLRALAGYFRLKFLVILNKRVNIQVNADFLNHIFHLPKKFFDTRKTGDITARMNDAMRIQQAVLLITSTTIIDGLIIAGSLIFMFQFSTKLAIISLCAVPVYSLFLLLNTKRIKSEQNEVMKSYAQVESTYINSLGGIEDILGFNASDTFAKLNKLFFENFQNKIEKLGFTRSRLSFIADSFGAIIIISILTIGALAVIDKSILLGQLMAAYSLLANMLPSVNRLVEASISLQGASVASQRLMDMILVEKEKNDNIKRFKLENTISIEAGKFSWSGSKLLLDGINLNLEKGKLISMWGPSGAGKSTIVQLLQRKYELIEGIIAVDGIDARNFDLADFRKNIGVVPQNIRIFNGTLADNLLVGRNVSSINELSKKIDRIGLSTFITRFEGGLFSILGEDGVQLSGGETQMFGLARALLDQPEVLIIDEGLSAIDVEIENSIFNIIKNYALEHVVLVITHSLSTIFKTEYVYVLNNGKIEQKGRPQDLIEEQGYFQTIWNLQQHKFLTANIKDSVNV